MMSGWKILQATLNCVGQTNNPCLFSIFNDSLEYFHRRDNFEWALSIPLEYLQNIDGRTGKAWSPRREVALISRLALGNRRCLRP